jgi:hypothetical protein
LSLPHLSFSFLLVIVTHPCLFQLALEALTVLELEISNEIDQMKRLDKAKDAEAKHTTVKTRLTTLLNKIKVLSFPMHSFLSCFYSSLAQVVRKCASEQDTEDEGKFILQKLSKHTTITSELSSFFFDVVCCLLLHIFFCSFFTWFFPPF